MLHNFLSHIVEFATQIGYLGIFIGMFIESTPIPLPSELIMIPAGIASFENAMNLYLVILAGTFGNLFGAMFSYFIASFFGRKIIFKFGKYFFIKETAIIKIENFFQKHGEFSVFIGRMIIGMRHIISIPCGIAKMKIKLFLIYTFFGSLLWNSILAISGYFFASNKNLISQNVHIVLNAAFAVCIVTIFLYILYKKINFKIR